MSPDLGFKFEDSEALEHIQEQKDQASNASNETGRTKMRLLEDEYLDYIWNSIIAIACLSSYYTLHVCSTSVTASFIIYLCMCVCVFNIYISFSSTRSLEARLLEGFFSPHCYQ